jgi:hypothetical protein
VTHTLNTYDIDDGRLGTVPNDLVRMEPVPPLRLLHAKTAYTTRFLARRLDHSPEGFFLQQGDGVVPQRATLCSRRLPGSGSIPSWKARFPAARPCLSAMRSWCPAATATQRTSSWPRYLAAWWSPCMPR